MATDPLVVRGYQRILEIAAVPDFAQSLPLVSLASTWRAYRAERIRFLLGLSPADPMPPERLDRQLVTAGRRFAREVPAILAVLAERRQAQVRRARAWTG